MKRRLLSILPVLALLLLSWRGAQGAGAAVTTSVVAGGPLAGTQLFVQSGGLVRPEDNAATGARGAVVSSDGGRTWFYRDAGGGLVEVAALDPLPTYVRRLSSAVSRLRPAALGRVPESARQEAAALAVRELREAKDAWLARGPAALAGADVQQALGDLDQVTDQLAQALASGAMGLRSVISESVPRLHAVAAVALAQPRDNVTITIEPTTADFGDVPVGTSASKTITISTNSTNVITVGYDGSGLAAPFTSSASGSQLSTSKNVSGFIGITFSPQAEGDFTGQIVLTNPNLPGGQAVVQVKGKGTPAKLLAMPKPLDFGKVHIKTFKTLPFSVKNPTSAAENVQASESLKKPFSSEPITRLTGSYDPGETASINVSFSPKKVGRFSGSISVRTSGASISVPVTGEGVGDISVSTESLEFGTVDVGASATLPLVITNNTDQALPLTLKKIAAPYSAPNAPATIPANQSVTLNVTFAPTKSGSGSGELVVESGGSGGAFEVPVRLYGTGVTHALTGITFSTMHVAFGTVTHGMQHQQTFTITNNGTAATFVQLDGSFLPHEFLNLVAPFSFSIDPGASHSVTITFEANSACTHKGKVLVSAGGGTATVEVTATAE